MIASYLKVFIRLFLRQTVFTVINILGLAVGLACCLIIALYIRHELSFDRSFVNTDVLYRVGTVAVAPNGVPSLSASTYFPVAPLLEANFPEIAEVARMQPKPSLISIGGNAFYENDFKLVDPAFFSVFDFTWIEGNPVSALAGATDVVLTRSFADKYFGSDSPLNQSLLLSEGVALRVTGVIEDLPGNTHLTGSVFAAMALRDVLEPMETRAREWLALGYHTYVVLRPGVDVTQLQRELDTFGRANIPSPSFLSFTLALAKVTDIHMNPVLGDFKPPGSKFNMAVFAAIGIGILLVACANFVNLSTARSAQRFGEVGLRLTLGARRAQLIGQFLGESALFVLLAIVLALMMVELLLPGIQAFLALDLAVDSLMEPVSLAILLGLGLLLGLAAGWYPALLMSQFRPALALKRQQESLLRGMVLKNILVVLQFAIAIGMIVASSVIWLQLRFAGALDLGYAHDQVVVVATSDIGSQDRMDLLKERLLQGSDITAAAISQSPPIRSGGQVFFGNAESDDIQRYLAHFPVDPDYLSFYQIPLLAGRLLRKDLPSDVLTIVGEGGEATQYEGSFVLNESGARQFGWSPEEALGKRITDAIGSFYTVVGVVGDTIASAHAPATPAFYALSLREIPGHVLSVRLGDNPADALAFIDRTWNEINPAEPIIRTFLDDTIDARYRSDKRLMQLAFVFAALAIFISCMGLFGLASFNAERRTREIGVRKVMGGSVLNIVLLLTNDFSKLVLLANLIAWPVAWFAMERWLENFAYRIDLTPLVFVGSGLVALSIAWVTVGGTAAKAAAASPVLALRYE